MRQACDLVIEAAHGLKEGDRDLIVGTNTGGSVRSYYLYGRLYADPRAPLDYCGVDQYYGTWQAGGPIPGVSACRTVGPHGTQGADQRVGLFFRGWCADPG